MMTLDSIPQAITEVVSCECKTNCCIGDVNSIKYNSIAHSPAESKSNTIRNTAVSEIWKWLNHYFECMVMDFFIRDIKNVGGVSCITMDS